MTMRRRVRWQGPDRAGRAGRRIALACALAASLCACQGESLVSDAPVRVVLIVQEQGHEPPGAETLAQLDRFAREFDPRERIDWQVRHVRPDEPGDLDRAIDEVRPRVTVLLNDDLAHALGPRARSVPILLSSERSPAVLAADLAAWRRIHPVAALTWYSDSHARLLDLLAAVRGAPIRSITAYYHPVLDDIGTPGDFARAARSRGIRVVERRYDDVAELKRALASVRRDARTDALFIPICSESYLHREEVARSANATGLPAAYTRRDQVESGGLLSVDAPDGEIWKQIARYTVMLLHGADARSLEIAGPSKHEAAVNLGAAETLGLVVPYETLVEAVAIFR
jgi:hypothetical protein